MLVLFFFVSVLVFPVLVSSQIGRTYFNTWHPTSWTLQAELRVSEAGDTYGASPVGLTGRGFTTLITGYDKTNPGVYIHTNDDGHAGRGRQVWSQQAKLVPSEGSSTDEFGRWLVTAGHTLVVSAPYSDIRATDAGAIYVFNGTLRHWTQTQRLLAFDGQAGDHFGELMSLHNDRIVVSATGSVGASFHSTLDVPTVGAAYVFEREAGGVTWSRTSKLFAKDMAAGNHFSENVGVHGDWVVSTARNDFEPGLHSGSAYMFKQTAGKWSQQQKLISADIQYWQPGRDFAKYEVVLGVKVFAHDISLDDHVLAAGMRRTDASEKTNNGVYIFNGYANTNRWSLQQKLFTRTVGTTQQPTPDEGTEFFTNATKVKVTGNNIVASAYGPGEHGNTYLFKTFGNGWSLQQKVSASDAFTEVTGGPSEEYIGFTGTGTSATGLAYSSNSMTKEPMLHGGALFNKFRDTNLIHTRFHNGSCLLLWMSDHFLDGWDSSVLTVKAPDQSEDKFHPHCDQIDPFVVRYCPYQPEDEGVYIIKIFAAMEARFFWESSWQVQVEETGLWYRGDYATKMRFNFNATSVSFSFFDAENLIELDRPCFRCTTLSRQSWLDLQTNAGTSFWPLTVWNAPFYISDLEGRNLISLGNTCEGVNKYQCYQRIADGYYVMRLGGGLFGRLTGLPYANARWEGCGMSGTDRDQLVFRMVDGNCVALQKTTYTTRCTDPVPLDIYAIEGGSAPTAGGTAAPTVNTFGPEYVQYQMYSVEESEKRKKMGDSKSSSGEAERKAEDIVDALGGFF